jgi:hypothetical protein
MINQALAAKVVINCRVVQVLNNSIFGSFLDARGNSDVNLSIDSAGRPIQGVLGADKYWASNGDRMEFRVSDNGSHTALLRHERSTRVTTVIVSSKGPRPGQQFGRILVKENRLDTQKDVAHLVCR